MAITPPTIRDYYLQQFPVGVRENRNNPNTVVYQVDTARLQAMTALEQNIRQMGRQFQVLTADTALEDYETFLNIPIDNTLTFSERRVRILTKFAGQPATLTNIKIIAKEITGVDITIYEYGLPTDPFYDNLNHPWKVKIVVDLNDPNIKGFKHSYFETIMMQIFPAHTEWAADSFVYIARLSYLVPADPGRQEFILDQEYLQFEGF